MQLNLSVIALIGSVAALPASDLPIRSPSTGSSPLSTAGLQNATLGRSRGGQSQCVTGFIQVHANTSRNFQVETSEIPTNQTTLTNLLLEEFTPGASKVTPPFVTVDETFTIGASFCASANASSNNLPRSLQFLTHGTGFDRYYWDFAPGYSYVDAMTAAGYSVFFYDRLGNGLSEHPDPRIIQAPLQIELANSIATLLRNGSLFSTKFPTIVGVGHSFGSAITTGVNSEYPSTFSASVLTGFGTNTTVTTAPFDSALSPSIASASDPLRFSDLPSGYTCGETVQGVQFDFFRAPGFDPRILTQAFQQRSTSSIGEMLGGPPVGSVAKSYTSPVVVLNGENDFPYCGGNCSYPVNQAETVRDAFYPKVKANDFAAYLAPVAGHGLNLHYSASTAYEFAMKFLKARDL